MKLLLFSSMIFVAMLANLSAVWADGTKVCNPAYGGEAECSCILGGGCDLRSCTRRCTCDGGGCDMSDCVSECSCNGGGCSESERGNDPTRAVGTKVCNPTYGGAAECSCIMGGGCDLRNCTRGCSCDGGECDMRDCVSQCSCGGKGKCIINPHQKLFTSSCTGGGCYVERGNSPTSDAMTFMSAWSLASLSFVGAAAVMMI